MGKPNSKTNDQIARELLDLDLTREERIERLRELARSDEELPDELLDAAMQKLMERLTE